MPADDAIQCLTRHATDPFEPMNLRLPAFAAVCLLLTACATGPRQAALDAEVNATIQASDWAARSQVTGLAAPLNWNHKSFGDRRPTRYQPVFHEGRPALHANSFGGNSSMRVTVPATAGARNGRLRFSWFVPALIDQADLKNSEVDDAVARIILLFGGDRDNRFSARDHVLSELANLISGEPLPYATLIYVWDNRYPTGSVIANPHTTRIRHLVVESGPQRLGQWVDFERDVQADYQQVFGEAPGPLVSIGIMTDSNNTGATAQAWFGPLTLTAGEGPTAAGGEAR